MFVARSSSLGRSRCAVCWMEFMERLVRSRGEDGWVPLVSVWHGIVAWYYGMVWQGMAWYYIFHGIAQEDETLNQQLCCSFRTGWHCGEVGFTVLWTDGANSSV